MVSHAGSESERLLDPGAYAWPEGLIVREMREEEGWFEGPVREVYVVVDPATPEPARAYASTQDVSWEIKQRYERAGIDALVDVHYLTEAQIIESKKPAYPSDPTPEAG